MTSRLLHIDPFGGASGDMLLAALVDLGVPVEVLEQAVALAGLPDLQLQIRHEQRHGIQGLRAIWRDATGQPADPGELGQHGAGHEHQPAHSHTAWREIRERLQRSQLSAGVRDRALDTFSRLAEAEARVHGTEPDAVHFHEVGAVDAIADIVGVAAALEHLGAERISCGPLPLGGGQVRSAHGVLPAPAPATTLLCLGLPVRGLEIEHECLTPTGAAALASAVHHFGPPPAGTLRGVGVGLGKRDPSSRANLLRAMLLDAPQHRHDESAELLELSCNLDDESGERCAHVVERLLEMGALDAWTVAAGMKKGRPAVVLHALVAADLLDAASQLLLHETSSLGLRWHAVQRQTLQRREIEVQTPWGSVQVKQALDGQRVLKAKPEFEDCQRLARAHGLPLRQVQEAALLAASHLTDPEVPE